MKGWFFVTEGGSQLTGSDDFLSLMGDPNWPFRCLDCCYSPVKSRGCPRWCRCQSTPSWHPPGLPYSAWKMIMGAKDNCSEGSILFSALHTLPQLSDCSRARNLGNFFPVFVFLPTKCIFCMTLKFNLNWNCQFERGQISAGNSSHPPNGQCPSTVYIERFFKKELPFKVIPGFH